MQQQRRNIRSLTVHTATLALAVVATTSSCAGLAAGQTTPKVSHTAPDIAQTDQHHQPVSLRALTARGNVLVVFYRGHF
jgi:hypothetical protein